MLHSDAERDSAIQYITSGKLFKGKTAYFWIQSTEEEILACTTTMFGTHVGGAVDTVKKHEHKKVSL